MYDSNVNFLLIHCNFSMQIKSHHSLTVFTSLYQVKNSDISISSSVLERANSSLLALLRSQFLLDVPHDTLAFQT